MERDRQIKAMIALIVIVSDGMWKADNSSTMHQAILWVDGVRDSRISDTTIAAADLARGISKIH